MGPTSGINPNRFDYFPLEEYVRKIKVEDYVLEHMEETNKDFDDYLEKLSKYDNYAIIYYFIDSLSKEMQASQAIEHHYRNTNDILSKNIFFNTLQMSHTQVKRLHKFAFPKGEDEYRDDDVRVSRITQSGDEEIFWWGAKANDVKHFMDDFIRFYKSNSLSVLDTNPFLKSSLAHLLFVRIHPFSDGNGRTARLIHNIKFTETINKIYGMKLKICPLNLSQNILLNQATYARRINDIYFDLEHDSNDEINKWFDFILNMVDEQLYFSTNRLPKLNRSFNNIIKLKDTDNKEFIKEVDKMKIKV